MAPYNTGSSTTYLMKKWRDQLQSFKAPRERVKGLFKQDTGRAQVQEQEQ